MLKIAHRGASGYALENSFEAFDKALEFGVDMLECDLRMTKDKKLVLMHDKKIDRTTNGNGRVTKICLSELKEISLKNNQSVPTLEEFILRYKGQVKMMWDVKTPKATSQIVYLIKKYKLHSDVLVTSFYHPLLLDLLIRDAEIQTAISFEWFSYFKYLFIRKLFVFPAKLFGANIVSVHYRFVNQAVVKRAHDYGLKIFVFSPEEREEMEYFESLQVDGIITGHPDRIGKNNYVK